MTVHVPPVVLHSKVQATAAGKDEVLARARTPGIPPKFWQLNAPLFTIILAGHAVLVGPVSMDRLFEATIQEGPKPPVFTEVALVQAASAGAEETSSVKTKESTDRDTSVIRRPRRVMAIVIIVTIPGLLQRISRRLCYCGPEVDRATW